MVDQLNGFASEVSAWRARSAPKASSAARPRCRRGRHLEGPHRQRQLDGLQPHRPGPQHRRSDHRRRQRRPVARRSPSTSAARSSSSRNHQHDGRSAPLVRRRSDARGARGRHRGQARRPGARCPASAGTWKDLTDNVNSMASNLTGQVRNIADVATADRPRRPVAQDHRRREGRDPRAQEHHQHDGGSARTPSPPK